ncbi:MAG: VCBS repeat-containing protein [Planctomycetota bacterium]
MKSITAVAAWLAVVSAGHGQAIYPGSPDWVSTDTQVSTGAALADLDRDGWLDLVVANGNDISRQRLVVYYNQGDGTYPAMPDWQSADIAYNGHLDVADVNGDGWPDVAVAHLGNGGTQEPIARLYLNNSGTLSSLPDWTADVDGNAFGAAFGDMNNDGRPDLAVGTGWAYSPQQHYANYVYLNVAGALEATASWSSDDTYHYQGLVWVDANQDGWLDLAAAASGTQSRMYMNLGGTLETTASWNLTDVTNQDAIMVTAGDVTGDGRPDLLMADNNQLSSGSGRFRQYDGLPAGSFSQTANWTYYEGYCSAVALADVNADGLLDLATGGWWDPTRVFFNQGSGFGASAGWSSSVTSVVEKIVFGDIDKNGLRTVVEAFPPDGGRRLFHLAQQPVQCVVGVSRDGVALLPSEYVCNHEHGWVSVGMAPLLQLELTYTCSSRLDMAVTNWDSSKGNYVYYSNLSVPGDANCDGRADEADVALLVLLLVDRDAYDTAYPDCDADTFCDLNDDGRLDGLDIQGWVDCFFGDCTDG